MKHHPRVIAILTLTITVLTLVACGAAAETPSVSPNDAFLLPMETEMSTSVPCEGCAQATLAALQTQEKSGVDAQVAATAEIMRANAQATLNSVSLTSSVVQTQEQNNANVIAAQVAATAAIENANAQATLIAVGSTQSAALTQVQYSQQVTAEVATQNAAATVTQQNNNFLAASTQTAVSNLIATQTQSAIATSQWYVDQARQRDEQVQDQITFLWLWCPPLFIVAFAIVCLLFFWRWMKIRETQQLIDMQPDAPIIIEHEQRQGSDAANIQNQPANPTDHVPNWLDEAKRKLIANKKDDDDNPDS